MGVSLWKGRCCRHDKGRVLVVPECIREDTKQACLRQPEEKAALRDRHRKGSREKPAKLVRHDQAALGTLLVKFKLKGPHRCECRRGVHQHQANPLGQQRAERTLGGIVAISPGQHIFDVGSSSMTGSRVRVSKSAVTNSAPSPIRSSISALTSSFSPNPRFSAGSATFLSCRHFRSLADT